MRVALYARVSTSSDEQEGALRQQLDRLRSAVNGHTATEYIDIASGSRDDRPQLKALMRDCRCGAVDQVIVTRLDRMSRSTVHGAQLLQYFSAEDTPNLVALDDGLDLNTVGGRMMARLLVNLAQAESERLSERVRHGKSYQRQHNKPFGPKAPFGYRWTADRSNFEFHPEESKTARLIIEHFLATGRVIKTLKYAMSLPHNRITTTGGLRNWLRNPSIKGSRCYGTQIKVRDENGLLKTHARAAGDYQTVVAQSHPALVSTKEFEQISAILDAHRDRMKCNLHVNYTRELTGLVVCGHCGHNMNYYFHGKGNANRMRCVTNLCDHGYHNVIKTTAITDAIWAKLKSCPDLAGLDHQALSQHSDGEIAHELQVIRQLQAMQDPMLANVIEAKQQHLDQLLTQQASLQVMQGDQPLLQQALAQEGQAKLDRESTRRLFVDCVQRVVVRDGKVEAVELKA